MFFILPLKVRLLLVNLCLWYSNDTISLLFLPVAVHPHYKRTSPVGDIKASEIGLSSVVKALEIGVCQSHPGYSACVNRRAFSSEQVNPREITYD